MRCNLTAGPIRRGLIRFSLPLIAGNLLQQLYNLVDTWVVGRFLGQNALAAVGSAFALMVLLTSILLGLCMGAGVVMSQLYGQGDHGNLRRAVGNALLLIGGACAVLTALAYAALPAVLALMRIPTSVAPDMTAYLLIIFAGLPFTALYNALAAALRSAGNSAAPLWFLFLSTICNIVLDLLFVPVLGLGVAGAAWATVIAQGLAAAGILLYFLNRADALRPGRRDFRPDRALMRRIASVSALTSVQQSIMNFGILMVQSLVNSFGVSAMAAFAAGVKIDAFAYSPAQDFGNGFATFVAQNAGAGQHDRVRRGFREATLLSLTFCAAVSALVAVFARPLLTMFIDPAETETLAIGMRYLRTEGLCYVGIGMLFLLYSTYRGLEKAGMSVILTIVSLGLRVVLAYSLAPAFGLDAVWWSIPLGWLAADIIGLAGLRGHRGRCPLHSRSRG